MRKTLRILLALGAFFVASVTVAACGGGDDDASIPSNAVASINGEPITKAEYEKWAEITIKSSAARGVEPVVPDPPSFTACVAGLREQARPKRGQPAPSTVTLRAQCRQQNDALVQQTMTTLIQQQWIVDEAKDQDITVSDDEVQRQFDLTKRQTFRTEAAFDRFLEQSGMSRDDVMERVRIQALAAALMRKIQDSTAPVTDAQASSYYERNRAQFTVPERRDVELVLTRTQAQANAARSAVEGGTSWAAVARQYSTDAASKASGGVLRGVSAGQQDRAFDQAAFTAREGVIVGPIKGQFGFYILRVVDITPGEATPFNEARVQIKALLSQQRQQEKMTTFVTDFQRRWKGETACRTGYVVELCDNAPTPRTTSTSAPVAPGTSTTGR